MKVLYIGHLKEASGWGIAGRNWVRSLQSVGVDVVCRTIDFVPKYQSEWLDELCGKSLDGVTHCIQHVLPHHMEYIGGMKNIGLFVAETDSIKYNRWYNHLSLLDDVWVANQDMQKLIPSKIIPHAVDTERYKKKYLDFEDLDTDNRYVFYTIGEHIRRKNLNQLMKVYYRTFNANDNVILIVKTNKSDWSPEQVNSSLQDTGQYIRENLRLYNKVEYYPPLVTMSHRLSDDEICQLHNLGDCFVSTSCGESWHMGAFDAMAFGNQVIAPNYGGFKEYLHESALVPCVQEIVFGADQFVPEVHTGWERWWRMDECVLMEKMRHRYNAAQAMSGLEVQVRQNVDGFGYECVGNLMKEYLDV